MDLFELLFIGAMFLVGIVGNVVQSAKKKDQPPPPPVRRRPRRDPAALSRAPGGAVLVPAEPVRPLPGRFPVEPAPEPARSAPVAVAPGGREESTSELPVADPAGLEVILPFEAVTLEPPELADWELGARPRSEPVRGSLEQPVVDWTAEHERFHRKYVDAGQAPPPATHGALDALRGRKALRQAILSAEVLGPPRALRPFDG